MGWARLMDGALPNAVKSFMHLSQAKRQGEACASEARSGRGLRVSQGVLMRGWPSPEHCFARSTPPAINCGRGISEFGLQSIGWTMKSLEQNSSRRWAQPLNPK